jgi:hypothetical protein
VWVYFSEEEVADAPAEHALLDVPVPVLAVVAFACQVLVDVGRLVTVDGVDLAITGCTWLSSCWALPLMLRNCSFFLRLNMRQ